MLNRILKSVSLTIVNFGLLLLGNSDSHADEIGIQYLDGHTEPVTAVDISPDGNQLVSVGHDSRVVVRPTKDLQQKKEYQLRDGGLVCLTFTNDSKSVLVSGNLADFSRQSEIDGVVQIDLTTGKQLFIELPLCGTTSHVRLIANDRQLIYLCGSRNFNRFDIASSRIESTRYFPDGFLCSIASSLDAQHFAVVTQHAEDGHSIDQWELVATTSGGQKSLAYKFTDKQNLHWSMVAFPANDRLLLCLPTGKLLTWSWNPETKQWDRSREAVPTESGRFTAIATGPSNTIWLAREKSVLEIDVVTGKLQREINIDIGKRIDNGILSDPIQCLVVLKSQNQLVAGLWDGRIAIIPIGTANDAPK